jgi:lipopolysaccharide/colanic/teichoic acid biosynthesis glycosyltransferase
MRPGLSGWAQAYAPYESRVEEAELRLSYDLYYLRHWSTSFDVLVMYKTIKTVLQAGGH